MDKLHRIAAIHERIRALIEAQMRGIVQDIRAYPTPIPRCDAQFNHLIERRERLFEEVARLDAAAAADETGCSAPLHAFIDASCCLDEQTRGALRTALREAERPPGAAAAARTQDGSPRSPA